MRDPDLDWKYLTVARLRELLANLPDDAWIGPNAVLNLVLFDKAGADVPKYLGYIDFSGDGELDTVP